MTTINTDSARGTGERLRRLYELALTVSGDPVEVFDHVVRIIAELFGVRVALVERLEGGKIHTLSMYFDGQILHEGIFELAGTPCATVREQRDFCSIKDAARLYPEDKFLQDYRIEHYIGVPVENSAGEVFAIINAMHDRPFEFGAEDLSFIRALASRVRLELERAEEASEAEVVRGLLEELSTPVIGVWDGVLLAPLIGTLTRERAERLTDAVLRAAVERRARFVILDVTGVRSLDTDVVRRLTNAAAAVRLVGAECVLTGVSAEVAQTLVQLGAELRGVEVRRSLADGLRHALAAGGATDL